MIIATLSRQPLAAVRGSVSDNNLVGFEAQGHLVNDHLAHAMRYFNTIDILSSSFDNDATQGFLGYMGRHENFRDFS